MPFERPASQSFTYASIQKNVPHSSGVYGISNSRDWIFIGETADLQMSLLAHLKEMGTPLALQKPTGFTFEASDTRNRVRRQRELIEEFAPRCNARS